MATLKDVVAQLQENNSELSAVNANIASMLQADRDRAKAEKTRLLDALAEKRKQSGRPTPVQPKTAPTTFKGGFKEGLLGGAPGLLQSLKGFIPGLVAGVMGGLFGGAAAATLSKGLGTLVRRGTIYGVAYGLLEAFGEGLITDFLTNLTSYLPEAYQFGEDKVKGFASTLTESLQMGALAGIVLGRKGFLAVTAASLLTAGLKQISGFDEKWWAQNVDFAGFTLPISNELLTTAGGAIAAFLGPGLIYGAITKSFGGQALAYPGAKVGRGEKGRFTKLSSENQKTFRGSFARGGLLAASVLFVAGNALSQYVESEFGETAGDVSSWITQGAALGFMFGPKGALIGAIAGLAISGGSALFDWLDKQDKKVRDQAVKNAEEALEAATDPTTGKVDPGLLNAERQRVLRQSLAEKQRSVQLMGGATEAEIRVGELTKEALAGVRDPETGALSEMGIDKLMLEAFQEGDKSKLIGAAAEILKRTGKEFTPENIAEVLDYLAARGPAISYMGTKPFSVTSREAGELLRQNEGFLDLGQAIREGRLEESGGFLGFFGTSAEEVAERNKAILAEQKEITALLKEYLEANPAAAPVVMDNSTTNNVNQSQSMGIVYDRTVPAVDPYRITRFPVGPQF